MYGKDKLVICLRQDLADEYKAVHDYEAHAEEADDKAIKEVLIDIANEERVHAGELCTLLHMLTGKDEDEFKEQGEAEVEKKVGKKLGKLYGNDE
jgi:rubrerythrin